jgi:hypothetical protein
MQDILKIIIKYLKSVPPLKMAWHLAWIFCMLCMLSITYIITFNFKPIMDHWERSRSIEHFRSEMSNSIAVDARVNNELNNILQATRADRAYIFRYHNGIPAVAGVPFMFHSNTHEVIRPGTSRVIMFNQRLPSSLNVSMNVEFSKNNCVIYNGLSERVDGVNHWYWQTRGSHSMIRCAIYTRSGDMLGFVGLDYIANPTDHDHADNELKLKASAVLLSRLFETN